jgi:hypothetical protein
MIIILLKKLKQTKKNIYIEKNYIGKWDQKPKKIYIALHTI